MEIEKCQKIFIHTHTQIREIGEKPSRYFYQLLKQKRKNTQMQNLKNDKGDNLESQEEIMKEIKAYYAQLFKKIKNLSQEQQDFFIRQITKKLTAQQRDELEKEITIEMLEAALLQANKEKMSGWDGIPYEFYQTFWEKNKDDFLLVAKASLYGKGQMPTSHTIGIITLLYKKNEKYILKHWRPVSLLCSDYKIIAKAISNLLQKVLDSTLSPSQTASIPGRSMFSNLFQIRDTIDYCNKRNLHGYIISLDQEKAFDKVNRDFLYKVGEKKNS